MIYVGENKSILCKGDFHPAMLYKGNTKIAGYETVEFSEEGGVTLENCYNDKLHNAQIVGNSIQDGTPTPETPIEVQSVGELVTDGDYAGKYKVPVIAKSKYSSTQMQTFNLYFDEPLRKIGDYSDYIDFDKGVVVRNVEKRVFNGTEAWEKHITKNLLNRSKETSGLTGIALKTATMSSHLSGKSWSDSGQLAANGKREDGNLLAGVALCGNANDFARYIYVCPYSTSITVEEWKAQLATWYEEGNPFTVWYVITTKEEAIDLPELPTFKGTTIYEIDTSIAATLSGKYKKLEVE